jgi:hypothetical protein
VKAHRLTWRDAKGVCITDKFGRHLNPPRENPLAPNHLPFLSAGESHTTT